MPAMSSTRRAFSAAPPNLGLPLHQRQPLKRKLGRRLGDHKAHAAQLLLLHCAGRAYTHGFFEKTGAALAGEMSGHIFFADRFYGFDDATYAGARVLEILSNTDQPLSVLLADLPKTFSTPGWMAWLAAAATAKGIA